MGELGSVYAGPF